MLASAFARIAQLARSLVTWRQEVALVALGLAWHAASGGASPGHRAHEAHATPRVERRVMRHVGVHADHHVARQVVGPVERRVEHRVEHRVERHAERRVVIRAPRPAAKAPMAMRAPRPPQPPRPARVVAPPSAGTGVVVGELAASAGALQSTVERLSRDAMERRVDEARVRAAVARAMALQQGALEALPRGRTVN